MLLKRIYHHVGAHYLDTKRYSTRVQTLVHSISKEETYLP